MNSITNYQLSPTTSNGIFALLAVLIFSLYYLLRRQNTNRKKKEAPVPAGAWPVIGHLHKLRGPELPHRTLATMADTYGPAFTIRLGTHRTLVVSNSEVAKECFTVNDKNFSNRPRSLATKLMCYNDTMFGFVSYGPYWRELRKIVMMELLSVRRLESLKSVWIEEIDSWMKELVGEWVENKENGPVVAEMKEWFGNLTLNIGLKMVVGKRYLGKSVACDREEARRCLKAIRDYPELLGKFLVEDAVPFLGGFDVQGYQKGMKNAARELDSVLEGLLKEHKRKRISGDTMKKEQDFMDVMLSVLEDQKLSYTDADTINKSTCLNLILAATDTIMVVLTWTLSLLLNHKHVLKRAQEELKLQIGDGRHVQESDIKNLVYIQAIIKEVLRLYPPESLSGQREAIDDCTVAGYHVRAGTRLIVNLWKIHRDPLIWSDPLEFKPERFLTSHMDTDVWGQHFELMPFGSGRRACPGIGFALQVIPLTLARLLHGFEVKTPGDALVDMSESPGLVIDKATPLEVEIVPRLPLQLYGSRD